MSTIATFEPKPIGRCRWPIALALVLLPLSALADTVYIGKVAGQDVVTDGLLRFAYLRFGHELSLDPRGPNRYAECPSETSRNWECAEPSGWWELTTRGERITGIWRKTADGPGRRIALQATPRSYGDVLLGANRVNVGKAMHTGTVTWAMKKELRSGITSPILLSGPDATGLAKVNAALARQFDAAVLDALTMESYETDQKIVYADQHLVALAGNDAMDGGGAHPTSGFSALTWNLQSGEIVDWESLMRPAPAGPIDLSRSGVFLAAVLHELQRAAERDDGGCLSTAAEIMRCSEGRCADVPSLEGRTGWPMYPTARGLAVAPDVYSEAERGCRGETVLVPWSEVRGSLKEPSALLPK